MTQRLKTIYLEETVKKLMQEFKYVNYHQVPKLTKIVINRGIGESFQNAKTVENSLQELTMIAGQRGIVTRSKKSDCWI